MSAEIAAGMPELAGVEHRWIEVDGVRIHVAEAGTPHAGPSIVLIHGWPQHWWCWHRVIPLLAERHHVVALDSRGAGWSDAPAPGAGRGGLRAYDKRLVADELATVIRELGLDRPVVVGNDWGAWLALLIGGGVLPGTDGATSGLVLLWVAFAWVFMAARGTTTDLRSRGTAWRH